MSGACGMGDDRMMKSDRVVLTEVSTSQTC